MSVIGGLRGATCALACCLALVAPGCAHAPTARPAPAPQQASAMQPADRLDAQNAQKTVLAYLAALRSHNATAAAALMTHYRRAETSAPGWATSVAEWKTARVTAIVRPGRYIADERSFAELYEDYFGREPYKLVVLNVTYLRGAGLAAGSTDFVVTQSAPHEPWLINDYGGAPATGN